jgi:hypothetical protein
MTVYRACHLAFMKACNLAIMTHDFENKELVNSSRNITFSDTYCVFYIFFDNSSCIFVAMCAWGWDYSI